MARVEAGKCPECGETIEVDTDVEVGDQIFCPGCDCELEVTRLHPPRFKVLRSEDLNELEEEDESDEEADWYGDEDKDKDDDEEDKY
jgi:lysine biosynthesis protein LysW